jgi:SH3-like domain-containing protein
MNRHAPRRLQFLRYGCAAVLLASAFGVRAAEYQSIAAAAVLYDAPTLRGTKVSVAPRGMPVEVIVAQGDWARVRDSAGSLAWVERKSLAQRRTVVARGSMPAEVHASADDASPVLYRVQPGVQLDVLGPAAGGWVGVRHADGQSGFVRTGSVWGA